MTLDELVKALEAELAKPEIDSLALQRIWLSMQVSHRQHDVLRDERWRNGGLGNDSKKFRANWI